MIWRQSNWPLDISIFVRNPFSAWIKNIINHSEVLKIPKEDHHPFQLFATIVMDNLWFFKNKKVHNQIDSIPNPLEFAKFVLTIFNQHSAAWLTKSSYIASMEDSFPEDYLRINFDVAVRDHSSILAGIC